MTSICVSYYVTKVATELFNLSPLVAQACGFVIAMIAFEYRYRLNVLVTDFARNPDDIIVPLLAWLARHRPELLRQKDPEAFAFEAEVLDNKRVDVSIELELSEKVLVEPKPGGGGLTIHVHDAASLWILALGNETVFDVAP